MASGESRKRQRSLEDVDDGGVIVKKSHEEYAYTLDDVSFAYKSLTPNELHAIVMKAARRYPSVAGDILDLHKDKKNKEQTPQTFDGHLADLKVALHHEITDLWGDEIDSAEEQSWQDVKLSIELGIVSEVHAYSLFDTKRNALVTLTQMGELIADPEKDDLYTLFANFQCKFEDTSLLEDAMEHVVDCLTEEEKVQLRMEPFTRTMQGLIIKNNETQIFRNLGRVYNLLSGRQDSPESMENGDDYDEESEGSDQYAEDSDADDCEEEEGEDEESDGSEE